SRDGAAPARAASSQRWMSSVVSLAVTPGDAGTTTVAPPPRARSVVAAPGARSRRPTTPHPGGRTMPRLRQVPRSEVHPFGEVMYRMLFGDRDPVAEPGTASGTPGDWWTVFALVPEAFDHTSAGLQFYRSKDRVLDPKLRELGQIRAGWGRESRFVYSQ